MSGEPANKSMGFFAIYKEAYKLAAFNKIFFSQITLTVPFAMYYILMSTIIHTKTYPEKETSGEIDHDITQSIYFILMLFFTILLTSIIMYTVACFYTSKEIIYKKVVGVLRKCWERLIFTFFWGFFMGAIYTPAALVLLLRFFKGVEDLKVYPDPYFTGFFYMLGVWSVAIVVMELEKDYGIKALAKSVRLIFGKIWVSCAAYGSLEITFIGIILPSCYPVVYGNKMNLVGKLFVVIGCNLLTIIWIYFSLVRFTLVYLVCKSYHNEDISTATTHATVVPTVPLVSEKEVQLERVPV